MKSLTILFLLFLGADCLLYEIMTNQTGILYTDLGKAYTYYTKWHLCYYYDLGPYYDQIDKLELCVEQMDCICNRLIDSKTCRITTTMFTNDLHKIKDNMETVRKISRRKKRAPFEFVGKLSNMAFGIMDAETARQYDEKINELQTETELNRKLAREKTTLLQGIIRMSNDTFTNFRANIDSLNDQVANLTAKLGDRVDEIIIGDQFRDISSVATLIMIEHNALSHEIKTALMDTVNGDVTGLVPIRELEDDMNRILLNKNQALPSQLEGGNIHSLMKIATTKATLFNEKVFLEIGIPIIDMNSYTLFKTIPIPTKHEDDTFIILPTSKYFLFNPRDRTLIPFSNSDLQACLHFRTDTFVCNPTSPIYHNPKGICELALLTKQEPQAIREICRFNPIPKINYVIQINIQDKYFVFADSPLNVVNSCGDGRVEMSRITQNGILTVEPDCIVSTDDILIRAHAQKYFNSTKLIVPNNGLDQLKFEKIGNTAFTAKSNRTVFIDDYESDLNNLANMANDMIEEEKTELKFKNIHFDTTAHSYAILLVVAVIVIMTAIIGFIIYTKVNPLSRLLSLITGIPQLEDPNNEGPRNIIINIDHEHEASSNESPTTNPT